MWIPKYAYWTSNQPPNVKILWNSESTYPIRYELLPWTRWYILLEIAELDIPLSRQETPITRGPYNNSETACTFHHADTICKSINKFRFWTRYQWFYRLYPYDEMYMSFLNYCMVPWRWEFFVVIKEYLIQLFPTKYITWFKKVIHNGLDKLIHYFIIFWY